MKSATHWQPLQRRLVPAELIPWITERGSLTRRLEHSNQYPFSVQLLSNSWARPLADESHALDIEPTELVYQREVRLMDGDQANVYARTIVPRATFMAMQSRFNNLGNTSLGELLFTDATVERGDIEVACLKPGQCLYEMAMSEQQQRPEQVWARRSLFYLSGKKLLVNEIFLPTLIWS
ncbi:MAG: chorismate lyase [Gammaproteobacteria bacterium]|nr:chorismate lyase [Gammaproteobacteria bacterium]